jgi:hypothetical protein
LVLSVDPISIADIGRLVSKMIGPEHDHFLQHTTVLIDHITREPLLDGGSPKCLYRTIVVDIVDPGSSLRNIGIGVHTGCGRNTVFFYGKSRRSSGGSK